MGNTNEILRGFLGLKWMYDSEGNNVRSSPSVRSWTTRCSTDERDENNISAKSSCIEIDE